MTPGSSEKDSYTNEIVMWRSQRVERLKSRDGWLNLAGLYWLEQGTNTIGSDSSNDIVFPEKAPPSIGNLTLKGDSIFFRVSPEVEVRSGQAAIHETEIKPDISGQPTILETGHFSWFIIKRGDRYGIRLRDFEHPALNEFQGIESYDPDPDWIIEARFEAFEEPREMLIPTVLGTYEKNQCPGVLKFKVDGTDQELYPSLSGNDFFIVFADETSGRETYGGGRFLYAGQADDNGMVELDFNRAYNPPCAFTPFATCPLPPKENVLSAGIRAGEKFAGH
jgi:uncharacterized protein (DUF1684 family)